MIQNAIYLDSAVAIYALGDEHPLKAACRTTLDRASRDEVRAYGSVEMIQEVVHHRLRRTGSRADASADGRDLMVACTILNFDREVLDLSLGLIARLPTIRGRDAVHAATALAFGIERVVSPDRAFDGIPGITRVDPLDFRG